jgi:hypothetical protein
MTNWDSIRDPVGRQPRLRNFNKLAPCEHGARCCRMQWTALFGLIKAELFGADTLVRALASPVDAF